VKDPRTGPVIRVIASLLLALGALALFLLGRGDPPAGGPPDGVDPGGIEAALDIDGGIDSVLASFGIPDRDIRKRTRGPQEQKFPRTERRVTIGAEIVPVVLNAALNKMAHRYGGRAVASENVRFNTVTIHIELGGVVIHTVILNIGPRAAPSAGAPEQTST